MTDEQYQSLKNEAFTAFELARSLGAKRPVGLALMTQSGFVTSGHNGYEPKISLVADTLSVFQSGLSSLKDSPLPAQYIIAEMVLVQHFALKTKKGVEQDVRDQVKPSTFEFLSLYRGLQAHDQLVHIIDPDTDAHTMFLFPTPE